MVIAATLSSCVKYPPYEFPEDKLEKRRDTTTLALNEIISSDSIENSIRWLQSMGTRFALADNHRSVAVRIRDKFIKLGYSDTRLDSFPDTKTYKSVVYSTTQYNVIAELRGSRYPDSLIILGAHYDAINSTGDPFIIAPGADDNASGIAAMLEIARVMKKKDYRPRSSVQFVAFGAEETGLRGSYNYSSKLEPWGKAVKLMINNDMISYVSGLNLQSLKVNIISYSNAKDVLNRSKLLCSRYTSINYANDTTNYNRSDSYPFFLRGYKSVFFMSNSPYPYYHTSGDTYQNCNFDFCTEVTALSCALIVWSDINEL
jgi:leucyl aminopeptidase